MHYLHVYHYGFYVTKWNYLNINYTSRVKRSCALKFCKDGSVALRSRASPHFMTRDILSFTKILPFLTNMHDIFSILNWRHLFKSPNILNYTCISARFYRWNLNTHIKIYNCFFIQLHSLMIYMCNTFNFSEKKNKTWKVFMDGLCRIAVHCIFSNCYVRHYLTSFLNSFKR